MGTRTGPTAFEGAHQTGGAVGVSQLLIALKAANKDGGSAITQLCVGNYNWGVTTTANVRPRTCASLEVTIEASVAGIVTAHSNPVLSALQGRACARDRRSVHIEEGGPEWVG